MIKKSTLAALIFLFLFGLWEGVARFFPSLLFILPPPSKIFITILENRERLLFHALSTLKEMGGGFLLAFLASFPLAWTMLRFQTSRTVLQPFFIVVQCIPMFTIAPIMVIWFGWGYMAIVIPTALMIFFPLTLNIYQGLKSTPPEFLEFFKANQASTWQTFLKLRLPFAVPHIFAGFRISAAVAGIGAIAGEWAGAQKGLGILMLESRRNTDLEMTFSALFLLTLMSFSFYGLVVLIEKIALPPRGFKIRLPAFFRLKHRLILSFLVALTLLLELTGCHRKNSSETRLLLDWLPNPNHVPLFAGIEKGFFREEKIFLNVQKMHDSGGGISYLTSHQADLILSHMPTSIRAKARGADLKIVGTLIKEPLSCFIYLQNDDVKKPQDLGGKILGYCMGTPDTVFLDYLLNEGNIVPKEKRFVGVDFISALGTKKVDFIYGGYWNIEPFQLENLGVKNGFFRLNQFNVPNFYEMIILANGNCHQSSPEFVTRFRRALQKSIDFAVSHPEEAFSSYLHHNPDKRGKTLAWEKKSWEATIPLLCRDQSIDPSCLSTLASWLQDQKVLSGPCDTISLIP